MYSLESIFDTTVWTLCRNQAVLSMMKSNCYSGLWAGGAVMENILANKQSFIGTIEAGTKHRIMQWNLTGLFGATWAEELINVWGPAGETYTVVDVLSSHTVALNVLNTKLTLLHIVYRHAKIKKKKNTWLPFTLHPSYTHTCTHNSPKQTASVVSLEIQLVCPCVVSAVSWLTTGGNRDLPLQPSIHNCPVIV